jgi:hypothetical protein
MDKNDPKYPMYRMALATRVQDIIDDPDCLYKKNPQQGEMDKLVTYLKKYNLPIPHTPGDERGEDVIKMMVRAWTTIEALNMMCELTGEAKLNI